MTHWEGWFQRKGKQRFGFTGRCRINILGGRICRGPPVFQRWLHHVCTVCGFHTKEFHPQPADRRRGCRFHRFFECFLVTFNTNVAWFWSGATLPLSSPFLQLYFLHIAACARSFSHCFSWLQYHSSHCVLCYLNVSTLFHCHHCPDTSGDEKTFRNFW